ncbi:hypothetical protein SprV_0602112400 [Sparganum proliferum]
MNPDEMLTASRALESEPEERISSEHPALDRPILLPVQKDIEKGNFVTYLDLCSELKRGVRTVELLDKVLVFYGRYVDDIFCLADCTTDAEDLVQKFSSAHPSFKFTAEVEVGKRMGLSNAGCSEKKSWTGQDVNFHSFVPQNIKRNLVQGLAAGVRRICSPEAIEEELQQLRNTLRENGYPDRFILRNIGERAAKPTVATAEKKELFIRLPFAGDAESERATVFNYSYHEGIPRGEVTRASLNSDINPRYIGGSGGIMAAKDDEDTHPSPFEPPISDPGASEPPVITSYVSSKADTEADLARPPLRPPNPFHPGVLATDAACQLDVLRHDCHALGMNGAQVRVLE